MLEGLGKMYTGYIMNTDPKNLFYNHFLFLVTIYLQSQNLLSGTLK